MPLSLAARKSLRDSEEHLTKAQETIQKALGVEWLFEFDMEEILAKAEDDYTKNNPGACIYKEICTYLATNIASACKDEMFKESLIESVSQNKIRVVPNTDKKTNMYWVLEIKDGCLFLLWKPKCSNATDILNFSLVKIIPTVGVYSLISRMDLKNNQEKINEYLEKMKSVTKQDWCIDDESLQSIYPFVTDLNTKNKFGHVVAEILEAISKNICTRCKDEMVCEAFVELTQNARIVFRNDNKQTSWTQTFSDGNFIVTKNFEKMWSSTNENSYYNFEKHL